MSLVFLQAGAQTEGTISYVEKINLYEVWFGDQDEDDDGTTDDWGWDYKEWLPEWHHKYKFLHFNGTESIYVDDDSLSDAFEEQAYAKIKEAWGDYYWEEPEERIYMNTETGEYKQNKDLMGKPFLIDDELDTPEYKLTNEQGTVLGYMCTKATCTIDSTDYEIWFTMQIPVSHGPFGLHGLPGMILKAVSDDGNVVIIAQGVELGPLTDEDWAFDDKGKKVTMDEFKEIAKAKYEEMEKNGGGDWYGY